MTAPSAPSPLSLEPALEVGGLSVEVPALGASHPAIDDVSFRVERGEVVALVGESGCGKSLTALSVMGLLPRGASRVRGTIAVEGNVVDEGSMAALRGRKVAMVFQDPASALNPVMTVGAPVAAVVRRHRALDRKAATEAALAALAEVGIDDPARRANAFPHQLSGGMQQRALIAMALAGSPALLIADEPTTALDVTVEAQVLALLERLRRERDLAILFISHDLAVVSAIADRVLVMYAGELVETGPVDELLSSPRHPYTRALLDARPPRSPVAARGARLPVIEGTVPTPGRWPSGCRFAPRCPRADGQCSTPASLVEEAARGRQVRCHHPLDDEARRVG